MKYYNLIITDKEIEMLLKCVRAYAKATNFTEKKKYALLYYYIKESVKNEVELTPVGEPQEVKWKENKKNEIKFK